MDTDKSHLTRRDLLKATSGLAVGAAVGPALANSFREDTNKSRMNAMNEKPLHYRTLSDVAHRISSGELSSVMVTSTMLERTPWAEPRSASGRAGWRWLNGV